MRIAKPLLLISTPVGVAFGLYEAWRLAGGLVFLMAALIGVMGVALGSVIMTIRREQAEQIARECESATQPTDSPTQSPTES